MNLDELKNKSKILQELTCSIDNLEASQKRCENELAEYEANLNEVLQNKQKIENELRGKINEV